MRLVLVVAIIVAETILLGALLAWLILREVRGQYMDRRRLWGTPLILAAAGVVYLPFTVQRLVLVDLLLVLVQLALAVVVGWTVGALTSVRVAESADRRGRHVQTVSGWPGGAMWILFIIVRLAMQPVASAFDAGLITSPGVVLIMVAVARAVSAGLVSPSIVRATRDRPEEQDHPPAELMTDHLGGVQTNHTPTAET